MNNQIFYKNIPSLSLLFQKLKNKDRVIIDDIFVSEITAIISSIKETLKKDILIISTEKRKDLLYKNLSSENFYLLEFLAWETMPFEDIKPSVDIIGDRFDVLNKLLKSKNDNILICTPHSLLQKVIPKTIAKKNFISLKINDIFDFETLIEKLISLGYQRSAIVSDKAQFAIRGGIIDVFPTNATEPFRLEFFSDEIESIRTFDLTNQKTIRKVDSLDIFPADEFKLIKDEKNLTTILSYLKDDYIVIFDDLYDIENSLVALNSLNIKNSQYFISFDDLLKDFENNPKIYFSEKKISELSKVTREKIEDKNFSKITFEIFNKTITGELFNHPFINFLDFLKVDKIDNILDFITNFLEKKLNIIFLTETPSEKKHIEELLDKKNIPIDKNITFEKGFLSSGFIISEINECIIPYNEITKRKIIRRQKFREAHHAPYAEYHDLQIGDLVVHFHSGIGKYLGCEKHSNHLGVETEFLVLQYAKTSKLYVPLSQAHLVTRYIGVSEEREPLTELGSNKWQKTKNIAQRQIIGYASDLLHIQAQRELEGGFKFPKDSEEVLLFDLDFEYEETQDQKNAIDDFKKDMMSPNAMDRLILGDVGYGKTEVAMRAAFKTVFDGKKQVAVLVPTTVLAMQHFDTFKERMSSFPVNIEVISRLKTAKQNKEILQNVKKGLIDILIGTHRLLSQDVSFKDLGLLIIDEEQRFGVRAKEHLKKLKKGVDCLTLSATPIPRTLYMSLIKVKEMSIINTPPQDRLPIKTIISENEDEVIKNAILRELSRQGQVFFIHNRVESIYKRSEHIKKLIPNLKAAIVHGQMSPDIVDDIFHKFKQGDIDILFSTTIIENGIDVPNANTIIIDRSDTFGLADLYQLRGRVGRWNRAAYAYFLTPKNRQITEISQKRLHALLASPGFGGGMKIAMRDLEIRGAGDILGVKQSGQISNIGFHLYCKLLKRAILSIQNKKEASFIETKMEFSYPAYLPEDYIPHANLRMEIYYRLGEGASFEQVEAIKEELIDRFGKVPKPVLELMDMSKIKIFANLHSFTYLKFGDLTLTAIRHDKNKTLQKTLVLPKKSENIDFVQKVISLLQENFDL
ncbi:MAG: Transcription-repair-coupling factor [Candidatus Anoxychlamydiales bacterium]|nr:Transcription-repair-coupling factor [Candidatus Anoxychlamydiales bacterium]NGX36317.1 Transcription-repair-coupling factor [Candidatus Anoxychlamydiales bacterium]